MIPRFIALLECRAHSQCALRYLTQFRETNRMMDLTIVTLRRDVIFFYTERCHPLLEKCNTRHTDKDGFYWALNQYACLNSHLLRSLSQPIPIPQEVFLFYHLSALLPSSSKVTKGRNSLARSGLIFWSIQLPFARHRWGGVVDAPPPIPTSPGQSLYT